MWFHGFGANNALVEKEISLGKIIKDQTAKIKIFFI